MNNDDKLENNKLIKETNQSNSYQIIGESSAMQELLEVAKRIALSDVTVLIYGESGTGKELLARYIHQNSTRSNKKFIAINCAAIPNELLENELFGHKKGAFTDASNNYFGKFGYANEGTIFLDEISEMGLNLQAKLLRVVQFKEYEPLGDTETYKADVRIITATSKNLLDLIKKNHFREDLYYRLNVVPLTIPPLRDRKNDIEILAKYFLKMYNAKNNKTIKSFTTTAINAMTAYSWAGNIRELQNVIERAVVLAKKDYLDENDIILGDVKIISSMSEKSKTLKDAMYNFKKEFVINALDRNNWNQTKTAAELKIQRTYLARLIKELNINKL